MESVGTQIRTARLRTSLSLEQVAAKTCIPVKILQAIEADDLSQVTSAFFYKSFVRQFCAEVGLPVEGLKNSITAAAAFFPEPIMPGQGEAVIRSAIIRPARKRRNTRWLFPAVSLAIVLIACSGFYEYWEGARGSASRSSIEIASSGPSNGETTPAGAAPAPGIAQPKAAVPAEPDGRFHVELSAVERTWLSIKADGKQLYSGTLEVDQTKMLEGWQEGQLRTGNAGGVNIIFNGKAIGLAGPHGTVRTVVFTKNNYQVLSSPSRLDLTLTPKSIVGWLLLPPVH